MKNKQFLQRMIQFLPLFLFGVAIFIIYRQLQSHEFSGLSQSWRQIPISHILFACGFTLLNYLSLSGYDWLALRFLGYKEIGYKKILFTSFMSWAISNNTGNAWAAGGSVRYRFYAQEHVQGWDIAKIAGFLSLTFFIGIMTLGLVSSLLVPSDVLYQIRSPHFFYLFSGICAGGLILYWGFCLFRRRPLQFKSLTLPVPSPKTAVLQTLIACIDIGLAALVLWVFLQDIPNMHFSIFLVLFLLAQILGIVSQVPGGIGVFEGTFLWLSSTLFASNQPEIAIALVMFRVVYYFIPLFVAAVVLIVRDLGMHQQKLLQAQEITLRIIPSIVPKIFSILLFITGTYMLFSGAAPILPEKIQWLRSVVPLPIVEFSHLTGSVVGLLLLFLARGIYLKLDAAWYGTLILLGLGIFSSIFKGLNWIEVTVLSLMFICILISHRYFYRKSSLLNLSFDPLWLGSILIIILASVWFGFFAYRHVEYSNQLWWQFSYHAEASRFLRSLLIMALVVIILLVLRLITVYRPKELLEPDADISSETVRDIILKNDETQAFLALLGDKKIFWSEDKTAFISYVVTKKYWVAMGDPIGSKAAFVQLLWHFKEQADKFGAKIVFYEIGEKNLPLFLDLGLVLLKLGQEALIPLASFELEGKKRENLRRARTKLTKLGYQFEILSLPEVKQAMPRLKQISDAWLKQKNVSEKKFSLGFFKEDYIQHTRVAVARNSEGEIMGFANLWETLEKNELSVDLMRYDPESSNGVMDFIFAELMLWGKAQGFQYFNLGMAPLSGLERHPLAPLWHKIGTTIFDFGEEFYNFEGLYEYKAKFNPEWHSRYLASPPGISAPFTLLAVTRLVAGGWKGIIKK